MAVEDRFGCVPVEDPDCSYVYAYGQGGGTATDNLVTITRTWRGTGVVEVKTYGYNSDDKVITESVWVKQ